MDASEIQAMREKVTQDIDGLFSMVDADGNGYIEKEELIQKMAEGFEPLPPGVADNMTAEQQINKFMEIADTNRDGKVDKQELTAFFLKMLDQMEASQQ